MRPPSPRLAAILLGACLAATSCGGGWDEEAADAPVRPVPGKPLGDAQNPFAPAPDDLPPRAAAADYPDSGVSLLQLRAQYANTPASGPGPYLLADGSCQRLAAPPSESYPGSLVTLDTVNLDVDKNDDCVPEINIRLDVAGGPLGAPAKLRLRGSSSREARQKSYRIKFSSKTDAWRGEDTFQLNKHPWDLTRVRNKLAFDLMREVPHHPSLRTQFVNLTYADDAGTRPMGLYTHVEKMGKSYLTRRGWVEGSNVYKSESYSFEPSAELAVAADGSAGPDFEKVLSIEADGKDHRAVLAMTQAVAGEGNDFAAVFNQHFDKNNYLAWFSSAILLGNYDTINQNFGLYQPLGTQKFYFLPWDYDGALGYFAQPDAVANTALRFDWQRGIGNWWGNVLHRRFLRQTGSVELLTAAVQQVRTRYLTDAAVQARLERYRPLVEPLVTQEPDASRLPGVQQAATPAQWSAEYARLAGAIEENHRNFLQSLERPMPFWLGVQAGAHGGAVANWGWPQPFHPRGKAITYAVQLTRADAAGEAFAPGTLVLDKAGLKATELDLGALPAGDYLLRVTASDPDGHKTVSYDEYLRGGQPLFGVACIRAPAMTRCP